MTTHLVTFADSSMSRSAELCVKSAEQQGINSALIWRQDELRQTDFYLRNQAILDTPKGAGLWAWKPWIIWQLMGRKMTERQFIANSIYPPSEGDVIAYSDAGVEFIEPVQTVIDRMDQDIFLFGNEHEHAHWCKQDIVDAVWPSHWGDSPHFVWQRFGTQAQASVIFFRVNDYTRQFVKEWLDWCLFEGGRLIDDSPSRTPNHPEFKENRHDQAILTTLAYREGIKLHEWFVKYEGYTPGHMACYPQEFERPLFFHHRRRNHEWEGVAA